MILSQLSKWSRLCNGHLWTDSAVNTQVQFTGEYMCGYIRRLASVKSNEAACLKRPDKEDIFTSWTAKQVFLVVEDL